MSVSNTSTRTRTCIKCKQAKTASEFARANPLYFPGGKSLICISCLEKMITPDDWDSVDALMRHLDLPFDIEQWGRLFKANGNHTLAAYLNLIQDGSYENKSWKTENARWKKAAEENTLLDMLPEIQEAKLKEFKKRWSDEYTYDEYLWLEEYFSRIKATQNVSTPILEQYALDLCELQLRIKKKIRSGEDVKKEMDSRDNIIKMAGFEAKNAINAADFDSVGELITYFVKKGWQPNWAKEKNDIVDFTMHNTQQYLQRLVLNEGGMAEQVEQRREAFNTAKRLEEDQLSDEALKKYEETDENVVYEGEDELDYELSEWDV